MEQQPAHEKSIIDKIAAWIPGYGGYLGRANRRAADKLLRDAVGERLRTVRGGIDEAIKDAVDRAALDSVGKLERSRQRLDRLADRLRAAGSGNDSFWQGSGNDPKADPLHALDMELYQRADNLSHVARGTEFAAMLDTELDQLEQALDGRARLLQGLR
jgi:hypothetical protein